MITLITREQMRSNLDLRRAAHITDGLLKLEPYCAHCVMEHHQERVLWNRRVCLAIGSKGTTEIENSSVGAGIQHELNVQHGYPSDMCV